MRNALLCCCFALLWTSAAFGISTDRGTGCAPFDELNNYVKHDRLAVGTRVLAFDHRTRTWSGYSWNGVELVPDADHFKDLNLASPTVEVGAAGFRAYVIDTNPLVFSTVQTSATQSNRPDISALQDAAIAIGNVFTAGAAAAGERTFPHATATGLSTEAFHWTNAFRIVLPAPSAPPAANLDAIVNAIDTDAAKDAAALLQAESTFNTDSSEVKSTVETAARLVGSIEATAQMVEVGVPASLDRSAAGTLTIDSADKSFRALDQDRGALGATSTPCADQYAAALDAISSEIDGTPKNVKGLRALDRWPVDLAAMRKPDACDAASLHDLSDLAGWFEAAPPDEKPMPENPARTKLVALANDLQKYEDAVTRRTTLLADLTKVMESRTTTLASFVRYQEALELLRDRENDPCALTAGVITVERPIDTAQALGFTKNGSETFSIVADPDIKNVRLRRATDLKETYTVTNSLESRIDVDVAVVYTKLYDPTFGLITDPTDDTKTKKAVAITARTTRAGQVAALITFKTIHAGPLYPQFGAALSADKPGLFAGLAWAPKQWFKLSAGWTEQRVTKVAAGQKLTDIDASATTVDTRDGFAGRWYFALSITLNDIPFFKQK